MEPTKAAFQLRSYQFFVNSTPLHYAYTVSFINQIAQWAAYAKPVIPVDISRALVAIFIGINDIGDSAKYTFSRNNVTNFPSFYAEIIGMEFKAIETIYEVGYRNYLFLNLSPLERTPGNVEPGVTPHPNSTQVHEYNFAIASTGSNFTKTHPGTTAMVFETYSFLTGILGNPAPYGIKNTTGYCPNYAAYGCLPIQEYFWHNDGHMTWKVHEFLAAAVGRFLEGQRC